VLVVGGGPAGLAAVAQAAAAGLSVVCVEERPALGGQIFKQPGPGFRVRDPRALGPEGVRGRALIEAAQRSGAEVLLGTSVVAIREDAVLLVVEGERARTLLAGRIVLAPGAHDRPVAFPGWTLPGVLTAGGAQTLVKAQRVLPGRRLLFAGAGPLALAFPAQLHHLGAHLVGVLEAGRAPGPRDVARMLGAARGNLDLLRDAARYRAELLRARVPLRYGRIVVRAEGEGRVESVIHAAVDEDWRVLAGSEERAAVDALCVGYGFVASTELLRLAGCALAYDEDRGGPVAVVDEWMRTTVPRVLAAGDGTGVEGAWVAIDEGRLAALGAALELAALSEREAVAAAAPVRARLRRRRAFRAALRSLHAVGSGIHALATEDTVVCRCEEVTRGELRVAVDASPDLNVVKGLTRAGMGPCQGRMCGRAVAAVIAECHGGTVSEVELATPRTPVRPVPLRALADESVEDLGFFTRAG
jgi:NADPH-dependent 2,4-dienoyl-CoA reductase/sulfur reductase-like enzyme